MKIICTQENFKRAILNCERVVSRQSTLPILNNILLEAEKGRLKISATNLEIGMVVKIGAKIEKEGKITIPARILGSFVNNLPGGDNLNLEISGENLKIKSGNAKASIKGLNAADFPLIPQRKSENQLILPISDLKKAIEKTLISVANNEARPELTGINLTLKEKEVFFAATDSFRLSEQKINILPENKNEQTYRVLVEKGGNVIIPAATLTEIHRITGNLEGGSIKITIEENQVFFENNEITLVSRLINGKYPDYQHIIPKDFKTRTVGDKNMFLSAVKMASIFSSGKTNEIVFKISSDEFKTIVEARSAEAGENSTEIKNDVLGPSQEAILNSRYLLDGLNSISTSQVAILINGPATPIAIKEINEQSGEVLDDYVYIVMPIKN